MAMPAGRARPGGHTQDGACWADRQRAAPQQPSRQMPAAPAARPTRSVPPPPTSRQNRASARAETRLDIQRATNNANLRVAKGLKQWRCRDHALLQSLIRRARTLPDARIQLIRSRCARRRQQPAARLGEKIVCFCLQLFGAASLSHPPELRRMPKIAGIVLPSRSSLRRTRPK